MHSSTSSSNNINNNNNNNSNNTRLTTQGGCAIWYNEQQLLGEIEEHLGVTIQQVQADIKVAADEFDGKVVYGAKRMNQGSGYKGHASLLANAVADLKHLERTAQSSFLRMNQKLASR